jgi:hypothetical protein
MHNLPRRPVRFVPQNVELLKSQEGSAGQRLGATDYSDPGLPYMDVPTGVRTSYRTPTPGERVNGNEFFRRYINGMLDIESAAHKVIDALHRVKDSGGHDQLNSEEKTVLGALFPTQFSEIGAVIASVQLRISDMEVEMIRQRVALHLAEEMNWNAGLGGSLAARHQTRA